MRKLRLGVLGTAKIAREKVIPPGRAGRRPAWPSSPIAGAARAAAGITTEGPPRRQKARQRPMRPSQGGGLPMRMAPPKVNDFRR